MNNVLAAYSVWLATTLFPRGHVGREAGVWRLRDLWGRW